jgi:hypothetical protein
LLTAAATETSLPDMATPPTLPAFNVHMVDRETFSGPVSDFKQVKGVVSFHYSYLCKRVQVNGSFEGAVQADMSILGSWRERNFDGTEASEGSARFEVRSHVERLLLAGFWQMPGLRERWLVDLPI